MWFARRLAPMPAVNSTRPCNAISCWSTRPSHRAAAPVSRSRFNLSAALDGRYRSSISTATSIGDLVSTALAYTEHRAGRRHRGQRDGGAAAVHAIALSQAVRARFPAVPIIWGGISRPSARRQPSVNPTSTTPIRGQGEDTLCEVLDAHFGRGATAVQAIPGLSWRAADRSSITRTGPSLPQHSCASCLFERLGGIHGSTLAAPTWAAYGRLSGRRSGAAFAARSAAWQPCFAAAQRCRPGRLERT